MPALKTSWFTEALNAYKAGVNSGPFAARGSWKAHAGFLNASIPNQYKVGAGVGAAVGFMGSDPGSGFRGAVEGAGVGALGTAAFREYKGGWKGLGKVKGMAKDYWNG